MSSDSHSTDEYIAARSGKLAQAYNNGDVESALTMFADDGLEYSDYGVMALDMNKQALTTFLHAMFDTLQHLELDTISISGKKEFTAWEWEMKFVKKAGKSEFEDLDKVEVKEGEMLKMRGVSVTWWNGEDKIVKNHDYARFV